MPPEFSTSDERSALVGFLDQQRDALIRKIAGITDADARQAPTASSSSLLGLLKHSAVWEVRWFDVIVGGHAAPDGWPVNTRPEDDWSVSEQDNVEESTVRYRRATAISRQVVGERELDDPCARLDLVEHNVRWVLLHMNEETARHAGRADIIRETIDGTRGM